MSNIDAETVKKVAKLSRIAVTEDEVPYLTGHLRAVLNWVEQLDEVNTNGVEPMTSVLPIALKQRQDVVSDGGYPELIVQNAPAAIEHFFTVPKVIE